MAVTIKDVAAAAGVSPSTVSRTCKDSPSISRETKERVRRIMAQLGYEPNVEAEPVEAFSKTIGIILPSSQRDVYENAFHLEIIRGIGQFCNQRRYVNTVITGQDDAEVLDAIQSMVANAQADGFILLYSKKDCPVAAYLRSEGLLHVIVGKAAQSASMNWATAALPISGSATPCCSRQSASGATRCPCSNTVSPPAKRTAWRSTR